MTPTPEAREREAREQLDAGAEAACRQEWGDEPRHPVSQRKYERDLSGWKEELDAYRTAVRAALVAEMVAGVENLGRRPVVLGEPYDNGTDDGWNDATHEVLTLIRATAHPTETDNGKL
jgi:hypothetical protein